MAPLCCEMLLPQKLYPKTKERRYATVSVTLTTTFKRLTPIYNSQFYNSELFNSELFNSELFNSELFNSELFNSE
jgi:hypothetical protein